MSYLFVCGCARSGTTALAKLLNADERVAIGMERYLHYLIRTEGQLVPELFSPERFFDVREGDTFYSSLEHSDFYRDLSPARYRRARLRGDKIPRLYRYYGALAANFPGARIVFIFRNPVDVAASFEQRCSQEGGNWGPRMNYRIAIHEWNASLRKTLEWCRELGIFCISYEDFFLRGQGIGALAEYVGMDAEILRAAHARNQATSDKLDLARRGLSSAQTEEVLLTAAMQPYRSLVEQSRKAIAQAEVRLAPCG